MRYHDIYALSSHRLFNRTGLYAESHGIVANVSHKRAVLNSRLTRCAEFLGCRDRLRVSLQQRLVLLATSLVARRTGAAVATLSVIFALAHACDRCGKRLGEQDSLLPTLCGQFHRFTIFCVVPRVLLGRDLLKLFPELRLHISSLSRYVHSFLPPDVFNDFV
jgi:hypothetical protein